MDGRRRLLQMTARSVAAGLLQGKLVVKRIWRGCRLERSLKRRLVGAVNRLRSAEYLERQLPGQLPRQGAGLEAGGRKIGGSRGRVRGCQHLNGNRGQKGFSWDPLYQHRGMPREKKIRDFGVRPGFRIAVGFQAQNLSMTAVISLRDGGVNVLGAIRDYRRVFRSLTLLQPRISACWRER